MESIYILTVSTDEASAEWYFTTKEKAINFIKDNFSFDNPRKIAKDLYQGIHHYYIIISEVVDQRFAVAP
ncbi:MAG: hypothetical protein GX638_06995 [Crenarchaeota archaeon]|nr:hypothetical protein [Thermoproteota archaeon]